MRPRRERPRGKGSRLRRVLFRLLVALSAIPGRRVAARRALIAAAGAVAVLLGVWGWILYAEQRPEISLDAWAIAHGTLGLFTAAGDVEQVPWQLAVARVLAPLAAAGAIVEFLLVAFAKGLRSVVAEHATRHVVAVGPQDRAHHYLLPGDQSLHPAIFVTPDDDAQRRGTVVVPDDGSADRWIDASNAVEAHKIVIARGRDDQNLAALAAAISRGVPVENPTPQEGAELLVEIDDRSLALRLSVRFAIEQPDANIEVVCVDDARVAFATDEVVETFERILGGREQEDPAEPLRVAVIGDGALSRLLVDHMAAALAGLASRDSRTVPCLAVVDPNADREAEVKKLDNKVRLTTFFAQRPEDLLRAWSNGGPIMVVVDYADPVETARHAVELVCSRPGLTIWVAGEDQLLTDSQGGDGDPALKASRSDMHRAARSELHVLSRQEMAKRGYLTGPFTRAALLHYQDAEKRSDAADDGEGSRAVTPWRPSELREAVRVFHQHGCETVPATHGASQNGDPMVTPERETLAAMGWSGDEKDDRMEIPYYLEKAGLLVLRPKR